MTVIQISATQFPNLVQPVCRGMPQRHTLIAPQQQRPDTLNDRNRRFTLVGPAARETHPGRFRFPTFHGHQTTLSR